MKIAVLGCGWLGLPLAEELVKSGYDVNGSTTDSQKLLQIEQIGAKPFLVSINPDVNEDFDTIFLDADILILNIPPQRRIDIVEFHYQQFDTICSLLQSSTIKHILMISSTSVYPSSNKTVKESDAVNPEKGSGQALLLVENMLQTKFNENVTIIRFGGLIGYDRKPANFLNRRSDNKDGDSPINVIHRDDCIAIICEIIKQQKWGKVYNACCDQHPTRKEFYSLAAQKSGYDIPIFKNDNMEKSFKIIDNSKLKSELGFRFKYGNPLDCL